MNLLFVILLRDILSKIIAFKLRIRLLNRFIHFVSQIYLAIVSLSKHVIHENGVAAYPLHLPILDGAISNYLVKSLERDKVIRLLLNINTLLLQLLMFGLIIINSELIATSMIIFMKISGSSSLIFGHCFQHPWPIIIRIIRWLLKMSEMPQVTWVLFFNQIVLLGNLIFLSYILLFEMIHWAEWQCFTFVSASNKRGRYYWF